MNFKLFVILSLSITVFSQNKKQLEITRTYVAPKIDGVLNDDVWAKANTATNFVQFRPNQGEKDSLSIATEVKMAYDDSGIYLSARLYDDPKLIAKQLSSRDNFGNSDFFTLVLNPNNDAQNDTQFFVFASGVQADAISTPTSGEDFSWNSVWNSAVKIDEKGWVVEMKVPYRSLRFDTSKLNTWGVQFHRRFRRNETQYSWNPIDVTKGNIGLYHGELVGLENIKPPTRLIFYPYLTSVYNSFDGESANEISGGLDLKYGLTENFTLDATLIPDFSQAGFDNVSLNLGPFEQTFSEQRQFFTEGVDLFNKGGLFFSRRVGGAPSGDIELLENETLIDRPETVKVLNAVKVSGRTHKGLGIGFFNSITEKTYATVKNSVTNKNRRAIIEPFTNYNVLVVDKQFNGNSSIGVTNTNVWREGDFRDANVSALFANISNKRNTYNIRSDVKVSHLNLNTKNETGLSTFFRIRKTHGNFRYSFDHRYADTKYNPNDLGLQFRNNYNNFGIDASYRTFEPKGIWNNYFVSTFVNYNRLANPNTYTRFNFGGFFNGNTKQLNNFGANVRFAPGRQYDYFEPRRSGSFFTTENEFNTNVWFSTNDNKRFALSLNSGVDFLIQEGRHEYVNYWFGIGPQFRVNDKLMISYSFDREYYVAERGYVTQTTDNVIFGDRKRIEIEHNFNTNYNFNPNHTLALTLRNYWATVLYDHKLFSLLDNGNVTNTYGFTKFNIDDNPDINFSTWNFDLSYSWQFETGSFLTVLYRNSFNDFNNSALNSYTESFDNLLDQPINHTFSIRLQYFLDYNAIPNLFNKKRQCKNLKTIS